MSVKQSPHEEYDRGFSNGWDACAARAQPAQVGQVLTVDDLWTSDTIMAVNAELGLSMDQIAKLARAIEQAVLAKRVPTKRGWMCLTDFQHELGEAAGGVTIYSDLEDLKANRPCWEQCGVIEVGIVGEKGGA